MTTFLSRLSFKSGKISPQNMPSNIAKKLSIEIVWKMSSEILLNNLFEWKFIYVEIDHSFT